MRELRVFGAPRARIGVSLEGTVDGARVSEVMEGSPAQAAGLRAGDLILRVDGQSLREPLQNRIREDALDVRGDVAVQRLQALALDWRPGEAVELEIQRGTERRVLGVTPEEAPAPAFTFGPGDGVRVFGNGRAFQLDSLMRGFRFEPDSVGFRGLALRADSLGRITALRADSLGRSALLRFADGCLEARGGFSAFRTDCVDGVHLVELNPELGEYFGATRGVLVSSVDDGSPLGLRPGDVILSIGNREVGSPDQARRILGSYDAGDDVPLRIRRRGQDMDVTGQRQRR
jgi:membrane-associated protease RseP (regulator of RpoE activity)